MHHARRLVPLLTSFNLHVPLYSVGSTQWQRIRVSLVQSVRVRDRGFVRVERLLPIKSLRSEPRGLTDGWEALANERRDLRSALCTPRIRICFSVQHRRHNKDKNTRKWQLVLSFFGTEKSVKSSWARGGERLNYKKRNTSSLSFLLEVTLVSVFLHSFREHCILKHFWWSRGVLDTQRRPRFHPRTLSRHEGCCDTNSNILFQQECRVSEFLSQTLHLSYCLCLLGILCIYIFIYIHNEVCGELKNSVWSIIHKQKPLECLTCIRSGGAQLTALTSSDAFPGCFSPNNPRNVNQSCNRTQGNRS